MASARAMLERRRSSRVPIRIPVKVFSSERDIQASDSAAEAVCVSRYGALIRSPYAPPLGSRIEVLHGISQELRAFRVISARELRKNGPFEMGVEIYHPARDFWGVRFPDEPLSA